MNIVMPLAGGYMVDRLGLRVAALLFCSIVSGGLVVYTVGTFMPSTGLGFGGGYAYLMMLLGRVLFALGAESAFVTGDSILVVRDTAGFEFRYGAGLDVSGEFGNDTKLSNGGEQIVLATPDGNAPRQPSSKREAANCATASTSVAGTSSTASP